MWQSVNFMLLVLVSCHVFEQINSKEYGIEEVSKREKRQLGLGNLLNPGGNQNQGRRGPNCQTPNRQRGKCISMDQCVLKELDEDYVKNKGYLCLIRPQGPVGVCCPDSIAKPVVYREGMFGIKNTQFARSGDEESADPDVPEDVEMLN